MKWGKLDFKMAFGKGFWTNLPYLRTKDAAFCNCFVIILPCKLKIIALS